MKTYDLFRWPFVAQNTLCWFVLSTREVPFWASWLLWCRYTIQTGIHSPTKKCILKAFMDLCKTWKCKFHPSFPIDTAIEVWTNLSWAISPALVYVLLQCYMRLAPPCRFHESSVETEYTIPWFNNGTIQRTFCLLPMYDKYTSPLRYQTSNMRRKSRNGSSHLH